MQNDEPPGRPGPASTGPRQVFWTQWQEIELAFSIRERFQECDSVVSLTNYVEIDPLYLTAIILPSLRPHLLSRVVGCLWSTVIYRVLVLQNNLRSHLLWLCESAESDLITSVGRGETKEDLLHILNTVQGRLTTHLRVPLTLILYHNLNDLSRGFSKVFEKFLQGSFVLVSTGS